jgi:hypothetical protein
MAAVTAASLGVWTAGSAAADPAVLTLQYTCSLPPFPGQAMTAQLTWKTPASVMVGQTTPILPINATATVGAPVTQALGVIGAATVEGRVDVTGVVVAPGGDISVTVPLTVPQTDVPASGPMSGRATGTTPVRVFRRPGHATITAGSELNLHLIPKDASGSPTAEGQVDVSCTLDPGQNNVLSSFEITAARRTSVPTEGTTTGPTASGTRRTVTAGPSTEVSGTAHPTATTDPTRATTKTGGPVFTSAAVWAAGPTVDR